VLSDVHGVLPALDAVLSEPDVVDADLIVVTGDHAAGPQPGAVLDRLQQLGDRVLLVRGNSDRDLVALARGTYTDENPVPIDGWAAQQLSKPHVELLARLPHPVTVKLDDYGDVLFCHGSPRDDNEVVLVDTRLSRWREAFGDVADNVRMVVCGHTHMPFIRLVDRRFVVNSGSVGMPYGTLGLPWAMITRDGITLRQTRTDRAQLADAVIAQSSYPQVEEWVNEYILNPPSDADALEAFGPRDGR
jgi:predicted phosphodiesterase